jgi:hypothetical protein
LEGGFPSSDNDFDFTVGKNWTPTELAKIIRLATVVWGEQCKPAIADLIGEKLKCNFDGLINSMVGDRFGATAANSMYHMVQESVESYNLGVRLRTFARTTVRARVPVDGEDQAAITRRENIANAHQAATYDLSARAIEAIDEAIRVASNKYPGKRGQVLASRLEAICTKFSADPFFQLHPNLAEPNYFDQSRDAKKQFWLNWFNNNAVAWHWDFSGIMDIREIINEEPMRTYFDEEFAFVCDAMWGSVIAANINRGYLAQSGSVATRPLEAFPVTAIDQRNYRQHTGTFNEDYNIRYPSAEVRSLKFIRVLKRSIEKPKGFNFWVRRLYAAGVEGKLSNEVESDGDVDF